MMTIVASLFLIFILLFQFAGAFLFWGFFRFKVAQQHIEDDWHIPTLVWGILLALIVFLVPFFGPCGVYLSYADEHPSQRGWQLW